tara:strand:+ start:464 stop:568 length:105 start_codon:yes stop_codon:yes gene_type:complete
MMTKEDYRDVGIGALAFIIVALVAGIGIGYLIFN